MSKSKVIVAVVVSLILEIGILCLGQITSLVQKYKILNLNKSMVASSLKGLGHHPIVAISNLVKAKNPIVILGTVVVLVIFLCLLFKTGKKKYELDAEYAIHGSSRYSQNNEIFVGNETVAIHAKQLLEDLAIEIKGGNSNENNE
ncbi:hypothetical protein ACJDU8_21140 [Clostridium sp. WILCCON 0269]|uniref:Uncharacterized protein n=1 Tax=Candidatus Clostridium eludens TaxID=3381663 RepID=A0ABW8SQV3_9CLOT